jgi:ribosomal protein S18 acetylase RimI-like enzyme
MPIEIRVLGPADTQLVARVADGVFDQAPRSELTAEFLADSRHHLAAAIDDGRIVGMVSALHYVHPDKPVELWINEIGVAPGYRRRGVGRDLLEAMLAHGKRLGCKVAWVLTESANTPAVRLYAASGGVRAKKSAVMFEFDLGGDAGEERQ